MRTPDKLALVSENLDLTYLELCRKAYGEIIRVSTRVRLDLFRVL